MMQANSSSNCSALQEYFGNKYGVLKYDVARDMLKALKNAGKADLDPPKGREALNEFISDLQEMVLRSS